MAENRKPVQFAGKRNTRWATLSRYSIRTLLVLVTILCALLAAWPSVKDDALKDVAERAHAESSASFRTATGRSLKGQDPVITAKPMSPMPFVVGVRQWDPGEINVRTRELIGGRKYYFWAFGLEFRLPYQSAQEKPGREGQYLIVMADGRVYRGLIWRETTEEVVVKVYPGKDVRLPRDEIEIIQRSGDELERTESSLPPGVQ